MNIQGEDKDLELYNKEGVQVYEYHTYSDSSWYERTLDKKGNVFTYKTSNGYWYECTYDEKGNKLTFKDSEGSWSEYTYNEKGNELTYENSEGTKIGFDIPEYTMKDLVEKLGNFKLIK